MKPLYGGSSRQRPSASWTFRISLRLPPFKAPFSIKRRAIGPPRVPSVNQLPSVEQILGLRGVTTKGVVFFRNINAAGLEFVKTSEGWVPHLYNDAASYRSVGYGHLVHLSPCNGTAQSEQEFLHGLNEPPQGTDLLRKDLRSAEGSVLKYVKVSLNDDQFGALTDFVFNVGGEKFPRIDTTS